MQDNLRELYKYRELLWMIVYRDIRVRYKQSFMGFMWAILMPVLIVLSGVVVRYAYAIASHTPLRAEDIAAVAVKSLPWAYIVSSIRFSCLSLINNRELVTKIYFPKEIFPIAAVLSSLYDLFVAIVALAIFLIVIRIELSTNILWVPVLLMIMTFLAIGIGLLISAASLFYRDVKFIVEVLLTFGIFFTPVFYDVKMLGPKARWLLLNPISPILDGFSACVAHHQSPDIAWLVYSILFALTVLCGGYTFFKHLEPAFAENI